MALTPRQWRRLGEVAAVRGDFERAREMETQAQLAEWEALDKNRSLVAAVLANEVIERIRAWPAK